MTFIQGNGFISYCFRENNMTCTCEKCNQERAFRDCLFVEVHVNLNIAGHGKAVSESQFIIVWNDSGKLLEKPF